MGRRRIGFLFLVMFILPLCAFAARPCAGLEYGIFMPQGEWSEQLGSSSSFRISIHQPIYAALGAALTAGYTSMGEDDEGGEFSMRPFVYLDVLAEQRLREHPQVAAAVFCGMTYTNQEVTFEQGAESSSVKGYSLGGMVSTGFPFPKKIYCKVRFVMQKATNGREICFGINF